MIVLIAPEKSIFDEIDILHQLFDAGLQYFHLRKPDKNETKIKSYLELIDEKYHKNIVLHQCYHLAEEYYLKGIHLQEQFRIDLGEKLQDYVDGYRVKNFTISSSFHQPSTIKKCSVEFDYYLLSPVFNSISKVGYKGKGFEVKNINKKIIGMGGVNATNLAEIREKGFQGVGILGGIWNTENPLKAFFKIKNKQVF